MATRDKGTNKVAHRMKDRAKEGGGENGGGVDRKVFMSFRTYGV